MNYEDTGMTYAELNDKASAAFLAAEAAPTDMTAKCEALKYDWMIETGCSAQVAEILVEQAAGANPDSHWGAE